MKAACRIFATALLLALTWDGKGEENRPIGVDGQSRAVSSGQTSTGQTNRLQLNFHGVSLDAVLDYLSGAAGLIIVKEADPKGTVRFFEQGFAEQRTSDCYHQLRPEEAGICADLQ